MTIEDNRLKTAIQACRQHDKRLVSAITWLDSSMPIPAERMASLDEETVRALDQFVYRFGKLQDAAGEQLFPALLAYLKEPYRGWSMRDRLNRLEQLNILTRLEEWENVRAMRNRLVHEYPDDPERQAAILEQAWELADTLLTIVRNVMAQAQTG